MMDELLGSLGGEEGLGSLLSGLTGGGDAKELGGVAKGSLGAILGGLAQNASNEEGAGALFDAIKNKHDGSALDDTTGFGGTDQVEDGKKILGHVFGDKQETVTNKLAESSGMDMGMIAKILPALAPVVMGFLGKKAQGGQLDANGLSGMLSSGMEDGFGLDDIMGLLGEDAGGLSGLLDKAKDFLGGNK